MDESDKVTCLTCERERRRTAALRQEAKPVVRVSDFDLMHHVIRRDPERS